MAAELSSHPAGKENRPPANNRHPTAPSVMTVNGHFANVGEKATKEQYEHGIQVINENQDFKYVIEPLEFGALELNFSQRQSQSSQLPFV